MKPDASSLVEAAKKLFKAGDLPRAIMRLREAAHLEPDRADVYLQIGNIQMLLGNAEAALANYHDALIHVPTRTKYISTWAFPLLMHTRREFLSLAHSGKDRFQPLRPSPE